MTKGRCIMIALIATWYIVFPFLLIDTGSAMFLLLIVNPVLSLLGGWIYGRLRGFDWLILWLVAFLFIPIIYFHMDGQWDCMIYVVFMSVGMVVGKIFQKKKVV